MNVIIDIVMSIEVDEEDEDFSIATIREDAISIVRERIEPLLEDGWKIIMNSTVQQ